MENDLYEAGHIPQAVKINTFTPNPPCFLFGYDQSTGTLVGKLSVVDGELTFEGNADESALHFMKVLRNVFASSIIAENPQDVPIK